MNYNNLDLCCEETSNEVNFSWESIMFWCVEMENHFVATYKFKINPDDLEKIKVKVYGVPKGGMLIAGFLCSDSEIFSLVTCPEDSDIIIDDIIDSGETKKKYEKYNKPFFVMCEKVNNIQSAILGYQAQDVSPVILVPLNKYVNFPFENPLKDKQDDVMRFLQHFGIDNNFKKIELKVDGKSFIIEKKVELVISEVK